MIRVNAYTGGWYVPSAKYRLRQLIPYLDQQKICVKEFVSKAGVYPPIKKYKRPQWLFNNLVENGFKLLTSGNSDINFFQREMLTMYCTFEPFFKGPRIFDVDDAIHLYRNGAGISSIARRMHKIICGNNYLAENFSKWNYNIEVIPTAVNVNVYHKTEVQKRKEVCIIVWSGTSSGFPFLYSIEHALAEVLKANPVARLRIVSNSRPFFTKLDNRQIEFILWSPEREYSSIKEADIGIMPLVDDEWSKGKCSYKMLCYMAAGLPVVVSPYGMNREVLEMGEIGIGPIDYDDWIDALNTLIKNNVMRKKFGDNGYQVVMRNFDVSIIGDKLANAIKNI